MKKKINDIIINYLTENQEERKKIEPKNYDSFQSLTEKDLYDIAEWGLAGEFSLSGAWDDNENIEQASKSVVNEFKKQLNVEYPEGFKNIPANPTIYRIIVLNNLNDLNKTNLGYSWFTNPNRINNNDFRRELEHLKGTKQYLIEATTNQSNIDIPRTLFKRDANYHENEIVVKDDNSTKIKIIKVNKLY